MTYQSCLGSSVELSFLIFGVVPNAAVGTGDFPHTSLACVLVQSDTFQA